MMADNDIDNNIFSFLLFLMIAALLLSLMVGCAAAMETLGASGGAAIGSAVGGPGGAAIGGAGGLVSTKAFMADPGSTLTAGEIAEMISESTMEERGFVESIEAQFWSLTRLLLGCLAFVVVGLVAFAYFTRKEEGGLKEKIDEITEAIWENE